MNNEDIISSSQLEDLPNELFYQIQSYLTANDLYKAFSNLNNRFDDLLLSMINLHFEIRSSAADQRSIANCFSSRIISLNIPCDSNATSITTIFSNVRSISFHRSIRMIPKSLSTVERIKLDLSSIRLKQCISLCSAIFSNQFVSLSTFHLFHRKSRFSGNWKRFIYSIRHQCQTITEFIVDIQSTIEWKTFEHLLGKMPNLQRLIIRRLNTRSQWSLANFGVTLGQHLPHLNSLSLRITNLGTNKILENHKNCHLFHPLFTNIKSKIRKSPRLSVTIIVK